MNDSVSVLPPVPNLRYRRISCLLVASAFAALLSLTACSTKTRENETPRGSQTVRVAGLIMRWITGDREANIKRFEKLAREAVSGGAKIICTPESFLDGYSVTSPGLTEDKFRQLSEDVTSGGYMARLRQLAGECDVHFVVGLAERDGEKIYNSAILIGPDGSVLGTYRKKYLWPTEIDWYTAGEILPAFATEFGKIGMMICSDRRQPAAIAELKRNGADLVFCLAGGGYGDESDSIVCQRASEGHVPIVFVHPVEFLVANPDGKIAAQAILGHRLDADAKDGLAGEIRYYDINMGTAKDD